MVRIVPDEEVTFVRPATQHDVEGFEAEVTGELRRAILYFWMATAARRVRRTGTPHSTMLIHSSVRVAVHEAFRSPIAALRQEVLRKLDAEDRAVERELSELWAAEAVRVPAAEMGEQATSFREVRNNLKGVVEASRTILDNSRSEERLDYSQEPVVAIAVGGNTLSRGLTLEGLVVSYFVRAASAYDTLLQMGRWFGYRNGYADLPRIWMTAELQGWFRHLAGVEAEIRRDISRYMSDDVTPETFAVRIRNHPALAITAAAKMRDAVHVAASFGGMRVQTRYFRANDADWLAANEKATRALIRRIGGSETATPTIGTDGYRWSGVAAEEILAFFEDYQVHEKAANNRADLIAGYIRKRNERGKLQDWNVAVIGSSTARQGTYDFGSGIEILHSPPEAADIKTLMSPRDAAVDLIVEPGTTLTEARIAEIRREQAPGTPLLTLYAIDHHSPTRRERREPLQAVRDVLGVGVVFPQPAPGEDDDRAYVAADLSRVAESEDDYLETEELGVLEEEQT
jgi:hypothetical protein